MKYPVYAVRDIKAGFGAPEVSLNEGTMVRTFSQRINQEGSVLAFAPKDYSLFRIGDYDTDSGKFDPVLPEFVIEGVDVYGVNAR